MILFNQVKQKIVHSFKAFNRLCLYLKDFKYMEKHSFSTSKCTNEHELAKIMLLMHAIEKGLSFSGKREFGGEKAISLVRILQSYLKKNDCNQVCRIAINVLSEYLKNDFSTHNKIYRRQIEVFLINYKNYIANNYAGTKIVSDLPNFNKEMIENFYMSRTSLREFSDDIITDAEIKEAMKIANTTPTACNRQACRVHVYRNKNQISQLIDNQLGDQGWCNNAKVLLVITTDVSFFNNSYERYQSYIDGGLFAMNLDMGLYLNKIGTCFKMFVRNPVLERSFKKIASIPENETPVVLILGGHYPNKPVNVPMSVRLDTENNICVLHN